MTTGLPLFDLADQANDPRKMARRKDPSTSHDAAVDMVRSGKAQAQRDVCLLHVISAPGRTAAEIAKAACLERHVPSRRLPELRDVGLVENREKRICEVMLRISMTWYPTERATNAAAGK